MSRNLQESHDGGDIARRRPDFKLPDGSCDAHCHVFGPGAVFPYAPNRRYTPDDAPKEALAKLHDRLGIARAVIVQASCHGTDNRAMLDAIAWRPDRYRGVAIVDDSFDDRAYQALDDGGVCGVRFNFVRHLGGAPDLDVFNRVIDRIKGRGWHVVLHLDASDIVPLSDMIARLPVPFVIDHMGRVDTSLGTDQPAFQTLLELVRQENCWIKVCGSERISRFPFDTAVPFAKALVEASPERSLWGTDFPHPNLKEPVDEADLVDLVPRFALTEEDRRRLLVDNPARLYGFAA
ncbi:amidohydrolase [Neorhizobium galegae]|uniref:amidohydrolase family protein n=1 Tax=Neorhizobium galegae TaxID=399 RepID=UPI0006221622|nr:amidohydrolase family protein [Neorhizobium galegae]CDZ26257.1 2-pyrone-4,6-dicarboxylic acid hydrolase [Neorhizobium galegae bv. officinalis]MCM2499457.1 amidohydrolase family protein [Neorhizobium galegae]MCQ1773111.1 amidohydrolase family protein [Neorhizobium galegae]MCQ1776842.1 amidohydrolase family protein [Neorhizobium galegae]MCQ1793693.1 amidohydrolase family protein [Neorhizobium galegae]